MELELENSSATDIIPEIIPCCYGKEVGVEPKIISTGLSAISIKRTTKKKLGRAGAKQDGREKSSFENRNSFFNLHRPEMTKINWVSTSPRKIEQFFHDHATKHGPFCDYLHDENPSANEDFKCLLPPNQFEYNEEEFLGVSGSMGNSILLKSCSMQVSDEDLDPSNICHKSRAEFCVTIGGKELSHEKQLEREDSLSPLTSKTKVRPQKGTRPVNRSSPMNSSYGLEHLSNIGESREVAAITPASDTGPLADDDANDDDNLSFRSILAPSNDEREREDSLPNEMTEADEIRIRNLQKQGAVTRTAPGGGNYQKKKPPVAPDTKKNKASRPK